MFRNRVRTYALIGAAAVAGVLAAVVPALGSSDDDAVRLHLGNDGLYFFYGGQQQPLSATRCELNAPATSHAVWVEVDGTNQGAGLNSLGMGVKTGGAQGTPCGRVDGPEQLTLELANEIAGSPLEGKSWHQLRLDLELKGDAWVVLDMYVGDAQTPTATFELVSGASIAASGADPATDVNPDGGYRVDSTTPGVYACAAVSDSGPDSGANDNCQWNVDPSTESGDIVFDKIVLSVKAGEFSLEGSGDFGSHPANDSLFFIANAVPVANDDSAITAVDTAVTIDVLANDTDDDGDELSVDSVVTAPSDGTATVNKKGTMLDGVLLDRDVITYTPNPGVVGPDSFSYRATDGSATSNVATVTIRVDPVITCTDSLAIPDNDFGISGTYTRFSGDGCPDKPVYIDVITTEKVIEGNTIEVPTVVFQPRPADGGPVDCSILPRPGGCTDEFEGVITFRPRLADNPSNTGLLEYDPSDNDQFDWRTMLWCDTDPQFDAVDPDTRPTSDQILPGLEDDGNNSGQGESWCIVSETTSIDSQGMTVTTWTIYGIGDPLKRLS